MDYNLRSKRKKMDKPRRNTATRVTFLEIPEILVIVLEGLDTERLKLCRKLCLTWANEISRNLRTRIVPRYSDSDWTKFQALLDKGKKLPRLICPFQEIYARICREDLNRTRRSFDWLHPPFPITRLTLLISRTTGPGDQRVGNEPSSVEAFLQNAAADPHPPSYAPDLDKCVWALLQSCSATLTHLATPYLNLKKEQILELGLSSLRFPELRALKAVWLNYFRHPIGMIKEKHFFLRIIRSAPKLKDLELDGITSAIFVLTEASLKGLERLAVHPSEDMLPIWSTFEKLDVEALKFVHLTEKYRGPDDVIFNRFSSSLEHFGIYRGLNHVEIPTCPFLTHLEFEADLPSGVALKSFPSLRRVTLHGDVLYTSIKHRSRTVTDVDIEDLCVLHPSVRINVLKQLLRLFPCSKKWKINYQTLQDFCQVVSRKEFSVEKLGVSLRCFGESPCNRSSVDSRTIAEADLEVFAGLHFLQNLRELEFYQSLDVHTCGLLDTMKLRPFNVSKIPFGSLPKLKVLRIFAKSDELPHDLIQLQNLGIAAEVTVDPHPTTPSWSERLVFMGNVSLRVAKTEFP